MKRTTKRDTRIGTIVPYSKVGSDAEMLRRLGELEDLVEVLVAYNMVDLDGLEFDGENHYYNGTEISERNAYLVWKYLEDE